MKKGFFILSIALGLSAIAHLRTDGFALHRIQAPLPNASLAPLPPSAEQALSQPFHYLGKGRQCFVFESADGQYVLKFFNQSYLQMPWYSFLIKEKEQTKRARRRHFYEHSYEIAFRKLGEEIVYLHLGPSDRPLPLLSLTDR